MKTQIRVGVFETNSSSTHAICVSHDKEERYATIDHHHFTNANPDIWGTEIVDFTPQYYGWEFQILTSPSSKASYLFSSMLKSFYMLDNKLSDSCQFIKDVLDRNNIKYSMPENLDSEECYIDHAECINPEWINKCTSNEDYLLDYLFSDTIIITGNDNEDDFRYVTDKIDTSKVDYYYKGN